MNAVGSLAVAARLPGGGRLDLAVRLERPPVFRLFVGRSPAFVAAAVPRLYTLCARAQQSAAAAALTAAAGEALPPRDHAALWKEVLHEHLWRLCLDWPPALGLPPAREAFVAWRAARAGAGFAAATEGVLAFLEGPWAAGCRARLPAASEGENFDPPALCPDDWLAYWTGVTEAPPLARPPSVAAAWQARLLAARTAARALLAGAPHPLAAAGEDGWGIGQAPTARGVLTHAVRLEGGLVADYRVWAPTDRHFSDAAGLAGLLAGGRWANIAAATRALEQAILALDPCLPYTLKVDNA